MRWKSALISFLISITAGAGAARPHAAADCLWPSFERKELANALGRRVHLRESDQFQLMKCPGTGGPCKVVRDGEHGTIISLEKVTDGGYFLAVRWDEPTAEPYVSYFGRYSRRESLVDE